MKAKTRNDYFLFLHLCKEKLKKKPKLVLILQRNVNNAQKHCRTGQFVAAQHNKINSQTAYFISCAPFNSDVIGVFTITLTVSICDL